ncbi:MAG TPA: helix-hairpin-helix domain-containing protein [Phycisphaerales bacterium]
MARRSSLREIPGIGATFVRDFARLGVTEIADLRGADPERLFGKLERANAAERHATSKNYLYVIRMAVYYANGGRDPQRLKWNAWKD